MSTIKLNVVCPVFNEADVIEQFHGRLSDVLAKGPELDFKVVYVVDRCTDNSLEILREIASRDSAVVVLALSARFGHQMSLLAGIEHSVNADAVIMMDSDLQHPPELIPKLVQHFREGADVVFTIRKDTVDIGAGRKFLGNLFYDTLNRISDVPINPNSADFRLISQRVAATLVAEFPERNMFLRGLFTWMGYRQVGVEFTAAPRASGQSKYSISQMVRLASSGILSSSTKPLQTGIVVGAAFGVVALVLMCTAIVNFFIDRSLPSGWTSLVTLLLLFSAVQLTVLGVIGLYIGGIYNEVKARPKYIIDEEISSHD
ncbi:glycosyltransferase family 2 protein [Rhizobium sp. 42MFCr.1]|uniref:glycosyltransferase family 2 protein n=1 Tax=Rhizobium sp. 42MFCr.1 TaxID=1048680 RepID=UPI0003667784|nr:glycosyltransferase family 2 protein [Rhizobium sp. 42MFCr.1]